MRRVSLRPRGALWRHGDFLKLWSAETISQFGTQVTFLALPLIAILPPIEASAFAVAALGTVEFAPFLLFTLPAGVWVDRLPRRAVLIVGDLGRAALLLSIPIAYAFDLLTLAQLFVVAFLTGILTVFFDVAYQSYLPSLVEREHLVEGNSKLEVSRSGAQIAGPGAAGVLIGALTAPYAILLDAVSFLVSGGFVGWIRRREKLPEKELDGVAKPRMREELKDGLRYVLRNPYLRAQALCTGSSNFSSNVIFSIVLVYMVRELGMSATTIGIVLGVGNAGWLLGALTANPLGRLLGVGRTTLLMALLFGPAMLLYPLAPKDFPIPFLVAGGVITGFGAVVYNIQQVSFRQAITPERMQGRMNSVMRFIVWGTIPLGSLTGGALASTIGLRETMFVGAIAGSFAFVPILFSPIPKLQRIPDAPPEETEGPVEPGIASVLQGPLPATDETRA